VRAAFCGNCDKNVYPDESGRCNTCASDEHLTGEYEAPDPAVSVSEPVTPADSPEVKSPIYKRKWFLPVAMLIVGIVIGSMFSGASESQAENATLKAQVDTQAAQLVSVTAERDLMKIELDPVRREAEAAAAEEQAKAEADAKVAAAAEAAAAKKAADAAANTFGDGVYLVGQDMKAGRYKGKTLTDMGYWAVLKDPNGDNIISNNIVKGQFYVSVKNGQYIELNGVEITRTN